MPPGDHTEYLRLLREKVDQLGKLAEDVCWSDNQRRSIAEIRRDIGKMFDHLMVKPAPGGKTLCKVFSQEVRKSTDKKSLAPKLGAGVKFKP